MKKTWVVAAAACAGCLLLAYYIFTAGAGFRRASRDDLNVPVIDDLSQDVEYPGPISGMSYPGIQRVYQPEHDDIRRFRRGDGMFFRTRGPTTSTSIITGWDGDGNSTYQVNCSRLVPSS